MKGESMDLTLLKKETEPKEPIQVSLYRSTVEQLKQISEAEGGIKVTNLIRHAINDFIVKYKASKK
jgi:hypothetical protein